MDDLDVQGLFPQPTPDQSQALADYRHRRDVESHAPGCACQYKQGESCQALRKRVPWDWLDS